MQKYARLSDPNDKRKKNKRIIKIVILVIVLLFIVVSVFGYFFGGGGADESAVRNAVAENSRLRLELQEKNDEIDRLNQELEDIRANVTQEPEVSIEPPNDEVMSANTTPTPKPTATPKATKRPKSTSAPGRR